jgi:DNA-binding NarL/FixJ family response regulator
LAQRTQRSDDEAWLRLKLPKVLGRLLEQAEIGDAVLVCVRSQDAAARWKEAGCASLSQLSASEHAVAALVAEGLSNKEIAKKLARSVAAVRNQLHSVYAKLGIDNRTALAVRVKAE